ncbi:TPA: resolvase [Bacillus toyonensis]|nr:resolvase [Bacillus sp. FDAARGOS_235]PEI61534.1 resolvase [Bacillus toyonensis]HDR3500226.1 resolvase [Bacillus toyonensis]HDR7398116.1 resolvase [Bacillus toyonensis]HDR7415317.1 resolvase [Bacillus toyonensis]
MDIIFEEEVSGVTKNCEQLKKMLGDLREDDTIYVTDIINLINSYI